MNKPSGLRPKVWQLVEEAVEVGVAMGISHALRKWPDDSVGVCPMSERQWPWVAECVERSVLEAIGDRFHVDDESPA